MPPFWSTIRTSLPQFEVSCDVGSGTRSLNRDLSDLKEVGILLQSLHLVQNAGKVRYRSLLQR